MTRTGEYAVMHYRMHMERERYITGRGNPPTERAWRRRAGTTGPARARRILHDVAARERHPSHRDHVA